MIHLSPGLKMASCSLPATYAETTLVRNLATLQRLNPRLVARICSPVAGDHIVFAGSQVYLKQQQQLLSLNSPPPLIDSFCRGNSNTANILIFGLGSGDMVDHIAQHMPNTRLHIWERDPWLLRLFLMRTDCTELLQSQRITLHLGADLFDLLFDEKASSIFFQPVLSRFYAAEKRLLNQAIDSPRVLLCTGSLFYDDVAESLAESGYAVFGLDIERIAMDEIEYAIEKARPALLFSINYKKGLAELAARKNLQTVCWEIDPAVDQVPPLAGGGDNIVIFSHDPANLGEYLEAGFRHAHAMPLATNPQRRFPHELTPGELAKYAAPVSFVGSSMVAQAQKLREEFLALYATCYGNTPTNYRRACELFEQILARQRADYSKYHIPSLIAVADANLQQFACTRARNMKLGMLIGESAAAEKRLNYLRGLRDYSPRVWGDSGWELIAGQGITYGGPAGHFLELNKIYCATRINLDINRIYQPEIVTMRTFDILACGGFLLAEHSSALVRLLAPGEHLDTYRNFQEMREKVAYYLAHPQIAREIAAAGRQAVQKRHTIRQRVASMLSYVRNSQPPTW